MRIVPNLKEVYECPNCGNKDYFLHKHTNDTDREYLVCACCHEEIYENETTYAEEQIDTIKYTGRVINPAGDEFWQKRKEKENFIFEMREEISNLSWNSHDARSMALVENIQNILNRIIDYIEEN